MPARDYASTRYSALAQIDARNVRGLQLAWTFSTGVLRGQVDSGARVIQLFEACGWAYDVRWPKQERLDARRAA